MRKNKPEIKEICLKSIKPAPYNPRAISEEALTGLKASLEKFGYVNLLVVNKRNMRIIAGHQRFKALQEGGAKKAHVILVDVNKTQEKAMNISLNNPQIAGTWTEELVPLLEELKAEIGEEDFLSLRLEELKAEVEKMDFEEESKEGLTDPDIIPPIRKTKIKAGDIFLLGSHKLLCGESKRKEDIEKLMAGKAPDLVFADPPYGIDVVQNNQIGGGGVTKFGKMGGDGIVKSSAYKKIANDETTETAQKFYEICVSLGFKNIVLWGGNYFTDFLPPSRCWIVWDKETTGTFSGGEMAWTSFAVGGVRIFKHLWNGLSREGNRKEELKKRVHPTQKPVGLFIEIFKRFKKYKIIFDGFLGSGSTLIACERLGRKCYGIEIDPEYCQVIIDRWEEFTGRKAVKG